MFLKHSLRGSCLKVGIHLRELCGLKKNNRRGRNGFRGARKAHIPNLLLKKFFIHIGRTSNILNTQNTF